jgi:hypothetical protein
MSDKRSLLGRGFGAIAFYLVNVLGAVGYSNYTPTP